MGGCSRQSIEDVKRFQETSTAVENQTNQTGIIQENESRENKVDNVFEGMVSSSPKYAERYSDVDMEIHTGKLVTKFTYSICRNSSHRAVYYTWQFNSRNKKKQSYNK